MSISKVLNGVTEEIDVSLLIASNFQVRRELLDGIDELICSIRENGLLEPIIVRPLEKRFEIVCGHRRFEALKRLKWKKIPCIVKILDEKTAYEYQLVENLQRRSLNPIEEATAFKKYVDEYGWGSVTELARKIGKSQEYVSRRLSLLRLPKEVQEGVMKGKIPPSTASELVSIPYNLQIELSRAIPTKKLSQKMVRELVMRIKKGAASHSDRLLSENIKVVDRIIVYLKAALVRVSSLIDSIPDDDILRVILLEERNLLSEEVDKLLHLRKKLLKKVHP
jgi:ParB family chromosome partitioning protein